MQRNPHFSCHPFRIGSMDYEQLLHDCLKRKPEAQKELYDLFAPKMLGVCYRYTKNIPDAENILQDGFIKVFKYLRKYNSEGELEGWIRKIMVNTALNYLKSNRKYSYDMVFDDAPLHAVSSDDPEVKLNTKELAEIIRQLPVGYQTIFNLYAVEGYSHVEIGEMLGVSDGTSRSQYARARALLIEWIEKKYSYKKEHKYGTK